MTSTATAFSSSESAALERETEVDENNVSLVEIWNENHQKICCNWIRQNDFKQVCLQFPDLYIPHSSAICDSLKTQLQSSSNRQDIKIYILADTAYGSCCIDEIAAAHIVADSIVHFGNACRSKVSRLPVLYLFPEFSIDIQKFFENIKAISDLFKDKKVFIYLDIGYHYLLEQGIDESDENNLGNLKQILSCQELCIQSYPPNDDGTEKLEPTTEWVCIFIGGDNSRFSNLSLTTKAGQWYIYDPISNTLSEKNPLTANYIRRRYYYIEKCKDAVTLGLVIATLTADGYLDIVQRLQEMARKRGVKTQLISVGRINPAKLANFLEIDCFVLIGCPFNNSFTSKEFYKPIVSVFEAEMALNPAWLMKYPESYVTDFKELLPEGRSFLAFKPEDIPEQDISLVSGRLRNANINNTLEVADTSGLCEQQKALLTQGKMEIMTTNTGLTFEDRTWKGLDPALGRTEPAKVQKGLSGIPIKYSHD